MERLLGQYKNSNAIVKLYEDGTKIRETEDDDFLPAERPETMDVCISEYCANDCPMCYAGCSKSGQHADFQKYAKLLNSIPYLCEMAININSDPHPNLIPFLETMKEQNIIVNATVHQKQFVENTDFYKDLTDKKLLYGLGISMVNPNETFLKKVKQFPNAIIHVINGIVTEEQIKAMYDQDIKMLILGYKMVGRGIDWYAEEGYKILDKQIWLKKNLPEISNHFAIISFDNLAVEQLEVKNLVNEKTYNERFLGEDGSISFYINLVEGYFARNSLSDIHYPIGDKTVDECFKIIRNS